MDLNPIFSLCFFCYFRHSGFWLRFVERSGGGSEVLMVLVGAGALADFDVCWHVGGDVFWVR